MLDKIDEDKGTAYINDEDVDFDFDAAWAERDEKAPKIRLHGQVYTLPGTIPAKLILFIKNLSKGRKATDEVDTDELIKVLGLVLGKANVDKAIEGGLGLEQIPEVIEEIQDIYRRRTEAQMEKRRSERSGKGN